MLRPEQRTISKEAVTLAGFIQMICSDWPIILKCSTIFGSIKDEGSKDETKCDRQYVSMRAVVVESDSYRTSSRIIVELCTVKPVESVSLSRDVISLRRKIKSFFTYCSIDLRRRKPIILDNSIRIEISYTTKCALLSKLADNCKLLLRFA